MKPALLSVVAAMAFSSALGAQSNLSAPIRTNHQMTEHSAITAAMLAPVTGKPYSAQKHVRSVQHLGDGTVISNESSGMLARNDAGLLREDMRSTTFGSVGSREVDRDSNMAIVADPVGHTMTTWQLNSKSKHKIAMVMSLPNVSGLAQSKGLTATLTAPPPSPPPPPPPPGVSGDGPRKLSNLGVVNLGRAADKNITHEDLGQQSIEGLLVTGKRTTTTIPTGKIGNDRPILITHEEWTSPDLGIVIKQVDNDPRTGEQTMELTSISRGDPDTALFHPPADYTLQDMSTMLNKLGSIGKPPTDAH